MESRVFRFSTDRPGACCFDKSPCTWSRVYRILTTSKAVLCLITPSDVCRSQEAESASDVQRLRRRRCKPCKHSGRVLVRSIISFPARRGKKASLLATTQQKEPHLQSSFSFELHPLYLLQASIMPDLPQTHPEGSLYALYIPCFALAASPLLAWVL